MVHAGPGDPGDGAWGASPSRLTTGVGEIGRFDGRVLDHPLAPVDLVPGHAGQVEGHPLPSGGHVHFMVVHLDAPHPDFAEPAGASASRGRQYCDGILGR